MKNTQKTQLVKTVNVLFLLALLITSVMLTNASISVDSSRLDKCSTLVCIGTVESTTSYWYTNGKDRYIETDAIIILENIEKNINAVIGSPEKITVTFWGGTVGDRTQVVHLTPGGVIDLKKGERVRIYCEPDTIRNVLRVITENELYAPNNNYEPIGIESFNPPANVDELCGWGFHYNGLAFDSVNKTQTYFINENCQDITGEGTLVANGFETWDSYNKLSFTFNKGSTTINYVATGDGVTACFWSYVGSDYPVATTFIEPRNGRIIGWDTRFNDALDFCNGAYPLQFDVQSIATHEAGHVLGLEDCEAPLNGANTMYYWTIGGSTAWRTLELGDKAGAQYIYPSSARPSVSISDPINNEQWPAYTAQTISATSSVSGGTISEAKYKVTSSSDYTYDSNWCSMTLSSGVWSGTYYPEGRQGYFYVSVRTMSNNGIYGYQKRTVYLPGPD